MIKTSIGWMQRVLEGLSILKRSGLPSESAAKVSSKKIVSLCDLGDGKVFQMDVGGSFLSTCATEARLFEHRQKLDINVIDPGNGWWARIAEAQMQGCPLLIKQSVSLRKLITTQLDCIS